MIMLGSEMIRINPAKNTIEYSTSQGRSWSTRYSSTSCGEFIDLLPYGNELLAATSKGIYYSTSQGRSWSSRYMSSTCGEFQCLMDGGRELLAQTSKGLYYSTSSGRSWSKRRWNNNGGYEGRKALAMASPNRSGCREVGRAIEVVSSIQHIQLFSYLRPRTCADEFYNLAVTAGYPQSIRLTNVSIFQSLTDLLLIANKYQLDTYNVK